MGRVQDGACQLQQGLWQSCSSPHNGDVAVVGSSITDGAPSAQQG